jgi:hypothetical protein
VGSELRQRIAGAVLVRLLPEERFEIENLARASGLSMAAFLRATALGTPGPRAKRAPTFEAEALARAAAALNQTGSSLQRIAANGGSSEHLFAALAETRAAAAAIRKIVGRKSR